MKTARATKLCCAERRAGIGIDGSALAAQVSISGGWVKTPEDAKCARKGCQSVSLMCALMS